MSLVTCPRCRAPNDAQIDASGRFRCAVCDHTWTDPTAALTQSADPGDNLTGNQLLNTLVQRQPNNIAALSLFAISQYQQNNFAEAIILWRRLLTLLPATDAHVAVINRSIAQAREQSGQGRANISKR